MLSFAPQTSAKLLAGESDKYVGKCMIWQSSGAVLMLSGLNKLNPINFLKRRTDIMVLLSHQNHCSMYQVMFIPSKLFSLDLQTMVIREKSIRSLNIQ